MRAWDLVLVLILGSVIGAGELIGRYRDEPMRAVVQPAGLAYLLINALASVGALVVVDAFDWRFGLPADASEGAVSAVQILVAGLSAAALFRSSLFTARVGNEEIGVGPSAVLDAVLRSVDRSVDRRRSIERLKIVEGLPPTLSFERDAVALASYGVVALQNLSESEAEWLGSRGNALRLRDDLSDQVKLRVFAMDLMVLLGEKGLRAVIAQLRQPEAEDPAEAGISPAQETQAAAVASNEAEAPEVDPYDEEVGDDYPQVDESPAIGVPLPPESEDELDSLIYRLERVVELSPTLAESHLALGRAIAKRARLKDAGAYRPNVPSYYDAARAVDAAIKLRPTFADAHLELGRIYTVHSLYADSAEQALHSALRFAEAPEMEAAADFQLAVLAASRESLEECVRWLEAGFGTGAAQPETRVACAAAEVLLGRMDEAISQAQAAVEAAPDHPPAWLLLGLLKNDRGEVETAAAAFARAPELVDFTAFPTDDPAVYASYLRHVGEGEAYQRFGDAPRAIEVLAPILTGFLPGCRWLFRIAETDEEDLPRWTDLDAVAQSVCDGVLVTHLGEPVQRSAPPDDPEPEAEAISEDDVATSSIEAASGS